jgi:hypothetical protein
MENALTHFFYLTTLYALYVMVRGQRVRLWYVVPVFMAAIARIEGMVHVGVILFYFAAFWWRAYRTAHGVVFTLIVSALWAAFQAARWIYFGDLLPNTAYAQAFDLGDRLRPFLELDAAHLSSVLSLCVTVFYKQGWWTLFFALPFLLLMKRATANVFLAGAVMLVFASAFLGPFMFGPARIDVARTTTQTTLCVALLACFAVMHTTNVRKCATLAAVYFLPLAVATHLLADIKPYYLGLSTKTFDATRTRFAEIAAENAIPRPTVANPDLGVMTWHKQFNVVDPGMLGTPEMAKLRTSPALSRYCFEYALPDIVESHGSWTTMYCQTIFLREDFRSTYEMLDGSESADELCRAGIPPRRYWIRRDIKRESATPERGLLDALQDRLEPSRIAAEIARCKASGQPCTYITRTVYKFVPELRTHGQFDEVLAMFTSHERAVLEGWRSARAHMDVIAAVSAR